MNPVGATIAFGTAAELIVQLRLWQFGVQAAAPLKDSGNDLIAIRGETFQAIQVKATAGDKIQIQTDDLEMGDGQPKRFHVLALVFTPPVPTDGSMWRIDEAAVFLVPRPDRPCTYRVNDELLRHRLGRDVINGLWPPQ
jgi:hypothetical protein